MWHKAKVYQGTLPKGNTLKLLQVKVRIKSFMKAAKIITTCINNKSSEPLTE